MGDGLEASGALVLALPPPCHEVEHGWVREAVHGSAGVAARDCRQYVDPGSPTALRANRSGILNVSVSMSTARCFGGRG